MKTEINLPWTCRPADIAGATNPTTLVIHHWVPERIFSDPTEMATWVICPTIIFVRDGLKEVTEMVLLNRHTEIPPRSINPNLTLLFQVKGANGVVFHNNLVRLLRV